MTSVDTLELTSQENGLIKSTPAEETLKKITRMRVASVRASNNSNISRRTTKALAYVVRYLISRHSLADEQIKELSSGDLNRMPEMIFADRGRRALLFGWTPIVGWFWAGQYILFKNRVKYLRSLDENIFDKKNVEQAIRYYYESMF